MIQFPNIDPVIFHIYGPIALRWYSLAYIVGLLAGYSYFKHIDKKYKIFNFKNEQIDSLLAYVVFGIILGGRVGYVLFYKPQMFIDDPGNVLNTLQGGMSFHGGLIGFAIATYIFAKKNNVIFLKLLDILSCLASIVIFFGRIANFINAELFGRVTTMPWGVIFPNGGIFPRHPSQIYEALTEGLLLFLIQNYLLRKKYYRKTGLLSASFGFFYGSMRFIIEFFREPDSHIGYFFEIFNIGQFYCLIMIIISIFIYRYSNKLSGNKN